MKASNINKNDDISFKLDRGHWALRTRVNIKKHLQSFVRTATHKVLTNYFPSCFEKNPQILYAKEK